jgi:hypothetical protein
MITKKFTEEVLSVTELENDPSYQRPLDVSKVQRIKRNFNVNALGVWTVSKRTNHGVYVIDAQHRTEVVRQLMLDGDHDGLVPCHVFYDLTVAEEAQMYLELNTGSQPTPLQKFKARIAAGETSAVEIAKFLGYYGWAIHPVGGKGTIQAIAAVDKVYALSQKIEAEPNLVQLVILTISRAWGDDESAGQGALFLGLGQFLAEYTDRVELDRLAEKLGGYQGGPNALVNNARQLATLQGWKLHATVASLIVEEYNKGRQLDKNKLPVWRKR